MIPTSGPSGSLTDKVTHLFERVMNLELGLENVAERLDNWSTVVEDEFVTTTEQKYSLVQWANKVEKALKELYA